MAKCLLWATVILCTLGLLAGGGDAGLFPNILLFSCLGVLAVCETIEKRGR